MSEGLNLTATMPKENSEQTQRLQRENKSLRYDLEAVKAELQENKTREQFITQGCRGNEDALANSRIAQTLNGEKMPSTY